MKNHGCNQLISILLMIAILLSLIPMSAIAASPAQTGISFEESSPNYQVYNNKDSYAEAVRTSSATSAASHVPMRQDISVGNLSVYGYGESIVLELTIDGQPQIFGGTLYPIACGSYYDGKVVVGDFAESDTYNVVRFRIENTQDTNSDALSTASQSGIILNIVLEKLRSGEIFDLSLNITNNQFSMFHDAAMSYYNTLKIEPDTEEYVDFATKTLSLMGINKNWSANGVYADGLRDIINDWFTFDSVASSENGPTVPIGTIETLNTVFQDFTFTNYSPTSLMGRLLSRTDWSIYHFATSDLGFFYVAYGYEYDINIYHVQIIACKYTSSFSEDDLDHDGVLEQTNPLITKLSASVSLFVEYRPNESSSNCRLLLMNGGPKLSNLFLGNSALEGANAVFYGISSSHSLRPVSLSPIVDFLVTVIPSFVDPEIEEDINNITTVTDAFFNLSLQYVDTIDELTASTARDQQYHYGALIKNVCTQITDAKMVAPGHSITLQCSVGGTYTSHTVVFRFSARP